MQGVTTISGLARRLGIAPRKISDQFYSRRLSDQICPIVDGRRLIPVDYVSTVEGVLRERGCLDVGDACDAVPSVRTSE